MLLWVVGGWGGLFGAKNDTGGISVQAEHSLVRIWKVDACASEQASLEPRKRGSASLLTASS